MGWASATPLFDAAVETTLRFLDAVHPTLTGRQGDAMIEAVVEAHYDIYRQSDWDTEDESKYWPYIRKMLIARGEIDPEDY